MISCKRLLLLAACVRAVYLVGNLLLAKYIMDYDTSSSLLSDSCEDGWPEAVAQAQQRHPWVVWDSVFMHRIALCGYEYEQFFAFFPAFSGLVRMVQSSGLVPGPLGFTVVALVINNSLFLLSAVLLAMLSETFLQDDRLSATAVLFFITSPASIHHSMMYTEALFTAASWLGLYCLYCQGSSLTASLAFAASAATRSNGLLNAGFLLHEHGRRFLAVLPHNKVAAARHVLEALVWSAVTVAPYCAYMLFGYNQFCKGVYADQQRPWCSKAIPSAYGYVQDAYWNVGFLRYYEWNQVPNFLLAGPTLVMSLWGALAYTCASPHLLLTGGLLSPQQLGSLFSSSSSSRLAQQQAAASSAPDGSGSGRSWSGGCAWCLSVIVGHKHMVCGEGRLCDSRGVPGEQVAASAAADNSGEVLSEKQQRQQQQKIPGVAYQSLRQRQLEVSNSRESPDSEYGSTGHCSQLQQPQGKRTAYEAVYDKQLQQQQLLQHQQQQQTPNVDCGISSTSRCSCACGRAYYSPGVAVFVVHWLFLTLVCLAVVHIQVSTRFLSSCVPLYWFAAVLMWHKGGVLCWLLWWYCFAFMGVGAVLFTNFYPWT